MPANDTFTGAAAAAEQLEREVAAMIVSTLNLPINADDIQPGDVLYGEGLGLDSIDILEVALSVSKRFGIQMRADSEENFRVFGSLRALSAYIGEHRTK